MTSSMDSVELHRYLGPADSLGRCIIGDVVTYGEFVADASKWVDTWVHSGIFQRLVWMSQRPAGQRRRIEA